jgi:sulfite reductase beta subunit-like hemoprotein
MSTEGTAESAIETLKRASRHLRGTLAEETAAAEPGYSPDAQQLLKPHGLYQQKNRDLRGQNPAPALMIRGRIPGGRLAAPQYLAWDRLAEQFGDGTLRVTSRQSIELHGVVKGDVKATLQALHAAAQTTQGACGDVARNVTLAPNPWGRADLDQLEPEAERLSRHFMAHSRAYPEIWLDGEKVPEPEGTPVEPVFGDTYLPRKFKIALTVAGENLIDLYTNDLAFAATFEADRLTGYFVFAGGGMGMTHNDPTTFPRLADPLGWIPAADLLPVAEAVVGVFRDHGNRADRRHARLKYVVQRQGVDWLRQEVARRSGAAFQARELPAWQTSSVLGWFERADGSLAYGVHTPAGRLAGALKSALRALVAEHALSVQLSPDQDVILLGIRPADREAVAGALAAAGAAAADPLAHRAMACVALPMCPLAITEGERALPEVLDELRVALARHGLLERAPVFRINGCANGCARPYSAELALVGQAPGKYALYAGGSPQGDRLAFEVGQKVALADLPGVFERLVAAWAAGGSGEAFGDFAARVGAARLHAALEEA